MVPAPRFALQVTGTFVIPHAIVLAVYGLLTRRYYKSKGQDGETHCRKCNYILRGLTEPRCPECGERI